MDTSPTIALARRLDLTLLRPDATRAEVERFCSEARGAGCQAVCVPGSRVALAAEALDDTSVKVSALIGFPFGTADSDVKRYEVEAAVDSGAQEFDIVLNPGWIKDGLDAFVLRELRDVREAADERPVKAILEMGLVTREEALRVAGIVVDAEVQFLVTGTGCSGRSVGPDFVQALREAVGPDLGIKAVGGVLTPADAEALIAAGANRIGVFALAPFLGAGGHGP